MSSTVTYRSAAEVRTVVGRMLAEAAEIGSGILKEELAGVLFDTDEHVVEAAGMALYEGGDTFVSELAQLVDSYADDALAFRVALALYTR